MKIFFSLLYVQGNVLDSLKITLHFSPVYVNQICLALLIDVPSQLSEAHEQGKPCDLKKCHLGYTAHLQICRYEHVVNI